MYEHPRGLREVVPNQAGPHKCRQFTVQTGGAQSTLQVNTGAQSTLQVNIVGKRRTATQKPRRHVRMGPNFRYYNQYCESVSSWIQNWIRINRIRIRNTIFQSSITRPLLPTRIWSPDLRKTVVKALTHLLLSGNVITTLSTSSPNCSKYVLRVSSVVT